MKMKKYLSLLLTALLLCGILTACGGSSSSMAMKEEAAAPQEAPGAMEDYAMAETMAAAGTLTSNGTNSATSTPVNRKWIITIDMSVETNDLDTLLDNLSKSISSLGGFVEDQNIYNGSTYASRRYRNANLTVRIPAEKVDQFTDSVEGIANVVSQNLNRQDITLQYVDTASRITALETEEARLLELLAKAETMEDLLVIEERLTDVRYELENYGSRLRLYDNQVDYATIYLYIDEVQEYTPVEEPTLWERISGGFTDSLKGVWEGALDLMVWLITTSPYLVVLSVLGLITVLLTKRIRKVNAKKKAAKNEEQK